MKILPVDYTTEANRDYTELIKRVERKWGTQPALKLHNQIKASARHIGQNPQLFPISAANPRLRKCVVTPQTILYYTVKPQKVVITAVFDTRQNPATLLKRS